jgi:FMN reductase
LTVRRLAVVTAGLSQPSTTRLLGDQLAAATEDALQARGVDVEVHLVELRDHAHDLMNNLLTGFASSDLRETLDAIRGADGLIVVTPIFNASYSGLFKVFADVLEADALTAKPVLIAATGGTSRHSLALDHAVRPLFVYLHAVVVPTGVFAASQDWGTGTSRGAAALTERVARAAGELAGLMVSAVTVRPPDPYDDPVPFGSLLPSYPNDPTLR